MTSKPLQLVSNHRLNYYLELFTLRFGNFRVVKIHIQSHAGANNMTPVKSPTLATIEYEGVTVMDKAGRTRQITGEKLRNLTAETLSAIANKFGNGKLADLLEELTRAECITKGGHVIADNRTRLAACQLALAYLIGRPVERSEVVNVNLDADSSLGLSERLRNSPALRASLKKMLEEVETVSVEQ